MTPFIVSSPRTLTAPAADLAGRLLLTASGVTRLLDGLEAAGLVDRASCPGDRRVTYAVLTDAGRERLEAASASHVEAIQELFHGHFSADDLGRLAELLGRLPGASDSHGADCASP